jgi:hypothetical protein
MSLSDDPSLGAKPLDEVRSASVNKDNLYCSGFDPLSDTHMKYSLLYLI